METQTKKTTAAKEKTTTAGAKPKTVKKPKTENKPTESKDVTNVQVHVVRTKKTITKKPQTHQTATSYQNDALVFSNLTKIQKVKNWVKRVLGIKK
jgi:hypothetical protein